MVVLVVGMAGEAKELKPLNDGGQVGRRCSSVMSSLCYVLVGLGTSIK